MLYKPKFCCNCGEKIERAEWNLLTSRRFCEVCAQEQKKHDWLPRAAVGGGLLAAFFGLGSMMSSETASTPVRNFRDPSTANKASNPKLKEPAAVLSVQPANTQAHSEPELSTSENGKQLVNGSKSSTETVNFCGAPTKKGTPCSRRVKTPGRCWQHGGKTNAERHHSKL